MVSEEENIVDHVYAGMIDWITKTGDTVVTRNAKVKRRFSIPVEFTSTPLVSVRKTAWKNCLREWEWFMSGSNRIEDLDPSVRSWWSPWGTVRKGSDDGEKIVENNYSKMFRIFFGRKRYVDQIEYLVDGIENHPYSRRNVITTWNTADMTDPDTVITNCHGTVIQTFVRPDNSLHLVTYQRSCDVVCGVPHNWLQYWAFLTWLAHRGHRTVGSLTWIGGDVHVYEQHEDLAAEIVRSAMSVKSTPQLVYRPTSKEFRADDFSLDRPYEPVIDKKAVMVV